MNSLYALSAVAMGQAYERRELSPLEVTRSCIEQIERWEPRLHALWDFDAEAALAQARASEARWHRSQSRGPLDGVPVTVKENIAVRGQPMALGSAATVLTPALEDSPPAARLRQAGAVLLARTTMPDFGMLSSGLSSLHATARNPWDISKSPGGSSAGAGAAAAAGYGPLHLGTDIGGSIRLPAAWCGVVGFKPSNGRVPIRPPYIGRVAGPLCREVQDAALMMATLSAPDWRDTTSLPAQSLPWPSSPVEPEHTLRGLKIGLWLDGGWGMALDPQIEAAVQDAAALLQSAGAEVSPLPAFSSRAMADGIDSFWRFRSWRDIDAMDPARQALVLPFIRQWVAAAADYSASRLFDGFNQIAVLREAAVAACQPFDFVISPVAPVSAFDAQWAMPSNDPERAMEHIAYTLPFNMSEQPAISLPCAHTGEGLPIGLQIVGQRHDDIGVLRLARAFEQLRRPLLPWPTAPNTPSWTGSRTGSQTGSQTGAP